MLNELKALFNVTLVRRKQQASPMSCLAIGCFGCGNFRSKLNAAANDTIIACRDAQFLQVGSWVGLTSMRRERASVLGLWVVREVIAEVVVARIVVRYGWVIVCWCKIHGCPFARNQFETRRSRQFMG